MNPDMIEKVTRAAELYKDLKSIRRVADAMGVAYGTAHNYIKRAAEQGDVEMKPVMPGYRVASVTTQHNEDGTIAKKFIQQKPERGEAFQVPAGHLVAGVSALVAEDGRTIQKWVKTKEDKAQAELAMQAAIEALKGTIPREAPVMPPAFGNPDLMAFYPLTDAHIGALAWGEETGQGDYDLGIAEQLVTDWFAAAIEMAPAAEQAVFAQMGDLLHWDGFDSVTPASKHLLDGDSRFPKMVRVVIRVIRRVIRMLLEKHKSVYVIMSDANHDPASEVWLREMFNVFYEDEPRVTVDTSPSTYSAIEFGKVSLFVHHGHRKNIKNVDSMFVGRFREIYGRTVHSYGHLGHLHSDEVLTTDLMKVERHTNLAAPDAYGSNWLSTRSGKVIVYHREFGEVSRVTLTPAMVEGAAARIA